MLKVLVAQPRSRRASSSDERGTGARSEAYRAFMTSSSVSGSRFMCIAPIYFKCSYYKIILQLK